ncbi:hypothetical protein MUB24_09595 [Lederbergia sp. NSJ-179]|nr:hypothetical protein [Lederbergia sp. NSJ-179]
MKKIKIVTDSTSDLTVEEIEYLNIHVYSIIYFRRWRSLFGWSRFNTRNVYRLKMKAKIEEITGFTKVEIDYPSPVISTHTGPGAIGFMYYFD